MLAALSLCQHLATLLPESRLPWAGRLPIICLEKLTINGIWTPKWLILNETRINILLIQMHSQIGWQSLNGNHSVYLGANVSLRDSYMSAYYDYILQFPQDRPGKPQTSSQNDTEDWAIDERREPVHIKVGFIIVGFGLNFSKSLFVFFCYRLVCKYRSLIKAFFFWKLGTICQWIKSIIVRLF